MLAVVDFKRQDRIAAEWLLNYHDRRRAYIDAQESYTALSATVNTGMPHGSGTSNPTEQRALSLTELERQKLWIMTVEDAEKVFGEKKREFLNMRRYADGVESTCVGRPGWVDCVQARYADWHEQRYGKACAPARMTMYKWWDEIVEVTVRIAIRRGLV